MYRRDLRDHLEGSLPDRHPGRLLCDHPGVLDVPYDGSQSADDGKCVCGFTAPGALEERFSSKAVLLQSIAK